MSEEEHACVPIHTYLKCVGLKLVGMGALDKLGMLKNREMLMIRTRVLTIREKKQQINRLII